jgi:hypothetical protein
MAKFLTPDSASLPPPDIAEAFPPAKAKAPAAKKKPVVYAEAPESDEDDEAPDYDEAPEEEEEEDLAETPDGYEDDEEDEEDEEEDEEPDRRPLTMKKKKGPRRPMYAVEARPLHEVEMDTLVEALVAEVTTASGKHVEIHSDKWHRCIKHVEGQKGTANKYAVCTASIGAAGSLKKGHGGSA